MRQVALFTLGAIGLALPASAQVVTLGSDNARRCYLAAAAESVSADALTSCDLALTAPTATPGTRVATHVNRGILRLHARNVESALADFDAALALDRQEPEAWLNKGIALLRAGRAADAVAAFDAAIARNTRRPALAHFGRAYAHEDRGALGAAYRDLKTAAALSPKWDAPRRELKRFRPRSASGGASAL